MQFTRSEWEAFVDGIKTGELDFDFPGAVGGEGGTADRGPDRASDHEASTARDLIPVEVTLDTDDYSAAVRVFSAVDALVSLLGYEYLGGHDVRRGSIIRNSWARLRTALSSTEMRERYTKVERALELAAIDERQADVDFRAAQAVAEIMKALEDVPEACVRIGSILLVKCNGPKGTVVATRTLSQLEIRAIERYPEIQAVPSRALQALATAISRSADSDSSDI